MPVDGNLLEILCCPVTKTPLIMLAEDKLASLNAAITAGETLYVGGETVRESMQEALVSEDMKVIYPVQDDIPVLLEEMGIGTSQFVEF